MRIMSVPGSVLTTGTVLLAMLLTGCGGAQDDPTAEPAPTVTVTVTATPDPTPTEDATTPTPTTTGTASPACQDLEDGESLAFIFVTQPAVGASVSSGFQVMGCSNVFEAAFQWELLGRDGEVLAGGNGTATCGSGCVGEFAFSVSYEGVAERQTGTLRVFASSPEDGSEVHVNSVPVILQPSA